MIPKIIHYCWFGGNAKSELIEKCIYSWHKYCPEYEIIEWNEKNWNIKQYSYAEEAYYKKKWAFVSDVARLDIVYNYGGIYLDTDVEILVESPFDNYLKYENVLVFENGRIINSGLFFAAKPHSFLVKSMLQTYLNSNFTSNSSSVNVKMNKPVLKCVYSTLKWNGKTQIIDNTYVMGCEKYGKLMKHYGTRSWLGKSPKYKITGPNRLKRIMRNPDIFEALERNKIGRAVLPVYTFLAYDLQDLGFLYFIKLFADKLKTLIKH